MIWRREVGCFGGADHRELLRRRARTMLNERLHPPGKDAPRHQDAVTASEADNANVRTKPDDAPVCAAAGMRLPQTHNVINRNIEQTAAPHPARPMHMAVNKKV